MRPLIEQVRERPLIHLAKNLGYDINNWLEQAIKPLNETVRVNPLRNDWQWTIKILQKYGAIKLPWYTKSAGAWQLPWERGKAPDEEKRVVISSLHQTGRLTLQEAASMLPVQLLNPKPGQRILDLCAAPGSKTTQICEAINDTGLVLANDPNSSRLNTLVSNNNRMGFTSIVITRHDGRHLPRVPIPGFDGVLVDVPCSGSATWRKNRNIWWKWDPHSGRSLHDLQVQICFRAANLLKPGGRMVYSTCSIDPIENEAVIAEILRRCPWLKLELLPLEKIFPNLKTHCGMNDWNLLDDNGHILSSELINSLKGGKYSQISPSERMKLGLGDADQEKLITSLLSRCIRINAKDNDTGSFFLASLKNCSNNTIAEGLEYTGNVFSPIPKQHINNLIPIVEDTLTNIVQIWSMVDYDMWSWWKRGKRIIVSSKDTKEWLFDSPICGKKGKTFPGKHWHPLKVINAGLTCFDEQRGSPRPKSMAMNAIGTSLKGRRLLLPLSTVKSILEGEDPFRTEMISDAEENSWPEETLELLCSNLGGSILVYAMGTKEEWAFPTWFAARLSAMIGEEERLIRLLQLEDVETED